MLLIDADTAEEALQTGAGIAFVAASARRRIARVEERRSTSADPGRFRPVGELVRRPAVTCEPDTTISDAAERMTRERVSSLLIPVGDDTVAILTDRDLRTRVVAERRGGDTPVRDVMTPRAETVAAEDMAGEVLLRMLELGVHHLPVTGAGGRVAGVVTDTDLMGIGAGHAVRAEERPRTREGPRDRRRVPPRAPPRRRRPGGRERGPGRHRSRRGVRDRRRHPPSPGARDRRARRAPGEVAWLALGSAARQEQALRTDQDHAIAFEGEASAAPYLAKLAELATWGLEAGGVPRCTADVMATNAALRLPLDAWTRRIEAWMRDDTATGGEQISIVADHRQVAGPLDADPALDAPLLRADERPLFLRHLGHRALDARPPVGFVRDLVLEHRGEHAGTVDLKHGGIAIIGNLARAHAARSGVTAKRTLDRLRGAQAAGSIDAETREGVAEAFPCSCGGSAFATT